MASTEHLRAHHSLRSQQKREAVLSAARAMTRSGLEVEWVSLAARAGVSEKFIHDKKHADVKAQVKEMIAGQAGRQAERQAAEDQATIASLACRAAQPSGATQAKGRAARRVGAQAVASSRSASLRRSCPACQVRCSSRPSARASARSSSSGASATCRRCWTSATGRSWRCATRCARRSASATPVRERVPRSRRSCRLHRPGGGGVLALVHGGLRELELDRTVRRR